MRRKSHVRFWTGGGVGDRPADRNKPTAPLARAGGGKTRFGAYLLAKGLPTQSARRLMLAVGRLPKHKPYQAAPMC